jgi:tetratricopeptide (TPR) repeat protein
MSGSTLWAAMVLGLLCWAGPGLAQTAESKPPVSPRMPGVSFEDLARQAREAWSAGRSEDALRFYRAGVELNPLWDEGWWYVGSIHYEAGRSVEARDAFRRMLQLKPEAGPAWALLGLCEYDLREYESALTYLWKADSLGLSDAPGIARVAQLRLALLLIRSGQFDLPVTYLERLVHSEPETPQLMAACGLMTLQMPMLPSEVPDSDRELVMMTGRAVYSALARHSDEARERFEALIARYPTARGIHYAYGLFLSRQSSEQALPLLRKEVELFPEDFRAHLQIAFELLTRGDPIGALPPSREAVRLAPEVFAGHLALGRSLVEIGRVDDGLAELQQAARLAPEVPEIYVALARGYARAGRPKDVEQARAKLGELLAKPR